MRILHYLLCSILLVASFPASAQTLDKELLPAKAQKALRDFVFLDGGFFNKGIYEGDDTLQVVLPRRVKVASFYLNQFEVSVAEYMAFLSEMPDPANQYDSTCWERDFPLAYNTPMLVHYFSHPALQQNPMVGITWEQANRYCAWKSDQINQLLTNEPYRATLRLPTETEWTYAAGDWANQDQRSILSRNRYTHWNYPWSGLFLSYEKDGLLRANCNMGPLKSKEGVTILDYGVDGALYPALVKSYKPHGAGFYNMAGNVSEWTADRYADLFEPLLEFYEDNSELLKGSEHILQSIRDKDAATREMPHKIIKGGSWADEAFYAQTAVIQIQDPSVARSTIGFRIALVIEKK